MFRLREAVPFTFVAEAERFRSNVTPPSPQRPSASQLVGRTLIGLTVVAGLVGSLLLGMPALEAPVSPRRRARPSSPGAPTAADLPHRSNGGGKHPHGPPGWSADGRLDSLTGHKPHRGDE